MSATGIIEECAMTFELQPVRSNAFLIVCVPQKGLQALFALCLF